MSTTLTAPEVREFAKLELVIEAGLDGFVRVGNALAKIRDAELYREQHATFDSYCRDRWKIAKSRAYQLIAAASTVEAMSTTVDVAPTNERQVRPLTKLPEAERAAAWQEAVDAEPDGPTAETVEAVVASRLQDEPEQDEPEQFDGMCPNCGGTTFGQDEDGRFCVRCKEPVPPKPELPKPTKPAKVKSTVVAQCQALWDALTPTERIFAANWFQEQL